VIKAVITQVSLPSSSFEKDAR